MHCLCIPHAHSFDTCLEQTDPFRGLLPCLQDFKTVMSALKSNNERWGIKTVTLRFRRPDGADAAAAAAAAEAAPEDATA
jgi:hypothetical protein